VSAEGAAGPAVMVRSRTFVPVYLTHALVHLFVGLFPAVLFALRDATGADYATLGAVFTAAMTVYGFGALPTGALVNRVAPVTVIRASLAGGVLACLLIAVAPSALWFAVALVLLGAACGPYHTAGLTVVSRAGGNDPRLLGHHGVVGNIGLAAAPTFGAVLAWAVSWRLSFACAAALGAVLLVWLVWRLPTTLGTERPVTVTEPPALPFPDAGGASPADAAQMSSARDGTHVPALALVLSITVALGFIYRGFATFLPALAAQRVGLLPAGELVRGGLIASAVYLVGMLGQLWGGHLGRRRRPEVVYAALLALTAVLLLLCFAARGWLLVVLLSSFSLVHFTTQPMDNTFTGKYTSWRRRGLGYGLSFGLSFGIGSFAAWAGGGVVDAAGGQIRYVCLLLAGVAAVAALLAVALAIVARSTWRRDAGGAPEASRPRPARDLPSTG